MTNMITMLKHLFSWLTYNNVVGPWPFFDRMVFFVRRTHFVTVKIAYRTVTGKKGETNFSQSATCVKIGALPII